MLLVLSLRLPCLQTPMKRQSGTLGEEEGYTLTTQLGREVFMLGFKVCPLQTSNANSVLKNKS